MHSLHTGVVDTQKLVGTGCHVDIIRLVLEAFLVEELVHGFILRCQAQIDRHNLKEYFAQMWRAAFRSWLTIADILAGVMPGQHRQSQRGSCGGKVANITDLRYKLCGSCVAYAIHGVNGFFLQQLLCKTCHLAAHTTAIRSFIAVNSLAAVWISNFVLLFLGSVTI